jgi:hypothetical protein
MPRGLVASQSARVDQSILIAYRPASSDREAVERATAANAGVTFPTPTNPSGLPAADILQVVSSLQVIGSLDPCRSRIQSARRRGAVADRPVGILCSGEEDFANATLESTVQACRRS